MGDTDFQEVKPSWLLPKTDEDRRRASNRKNRSNSKYIVVRHRVIGQAGKAGLMYADFGLS